LRLSVRGATSLIIPHKKKKKLLLINPKFLGEIMIIETAPFAIWHWYYEGRKMQKNE